MPRLGDCPSYLVCWRRFNSGLAKPNRVDLPPIVAGGNGPDMAELVGVIQAAWILERTVGWLQGFLALSLTTNATCLIPRFSKLACLMIGYMARIFFMLVLVDQSSVPRSEPDDWRRFPSISPTSWAWQNDRAIPICLERLVRQGCRIVASTEPDREFDLPSAPASYHFPFNLYAAIPGLF